MLRERRRHANCKPNRRLDRKSSRGMIYENEELRLRTININAEVEQGRSDIRKLRRENEQLKREIWNLRDEYDRINKKGSDEGTCDNCLQSESDSDTDDCGSCPTSKSYDNYKPFKFNPHPSEKDEQYENCTHEILPEKFNDLPLTLLAEDLPLNTEVYENHENMHKLMKEPVVLKPPSINPSEKNYQISGRDAYPHYTGQLSVLSEENLTNSDCISCINDNSDNLRMYRSSGNLSISNEILMQPSDPLISTKDSNDSMKTKRKLQTGCVESINTENEMLSFDTTNRHAQGKSSITTDAHCPAHFFSTLHQCPNEKFESPPYVKNPPDLFVSNALATPYHRLGLTLESNTACKLHQEIEDNNLQNLGLEMENSTIQVNKNEIFSQEKMLSCDNLSRSKVFRSEINLLVSCDGAKSSITRIEGQNSCFCQVNQTSPCPHASLPTLSLPRHFQGLNRSDLARNDEPVAFLMDLFSKCDLSDMESKNKRTGRIGFVEGYIESNNEEKTNIGRANSLLSKHPSSMKELRKQSTSEMMIQSSPSSPCFNKKLTHGNPRQHHSKHHLCSQHCLRKCSQDSTKIRQKLRRRFSEGNMDRVSRCMFTKACSYDSTHQKNQNQVISTYPEFQVNILNSSRESSSYQSTHSHHRKISESSHGGGKIPWCGCWGNGCL